MKFLPDKLAYPVAIAAVMVIVGAFVYHRIENWSWLDSFYFAASTLTTVGFGDLHPTHAASKIFTVFYILSGVSVMFYTITLFGAYAVEEHVYSKPFEAIRRKISNSRPKTQKAHNLAKEIDDLEKELHAKIQQLEREQKRK